MLTMMLMLDDQSGILVPDVFVGAYSWDDLHGWNVPFDALVRDAIDTLDVAVVVAAARHPC